MKALILVGIGNIPVIVESTSEDFNYDKPLTMQIIRLMENVMMTNIFATCFSAIY